MKKLNNYQWQEPAWKCMYNINEYWEYLKYVMTGKTNRFAMVSTKK